MSLDSDRTLRLLGPPLALVAAAVAFRALLQVGFTGEDFVILAPIKHGTEFESTVWRPLWEAWFHVMHALFGATSAEPYHAAGLALHLINTLLVHRLVIAWSGRATTALCAALLFGIGAAATDALAWVAAVNRPLSTMGALIALNGLVRVRKRPRLGLGLILAGLAFQYSHMEVYGTGTLVVITLLVLALTKGKPGEVTHRRQIAMASVVAVVAIAMTIHFVFLRDREGGGILGNATSVLVSQAARTSRARLEVITTGWGVPGFLALPLLGIAIVTLAIRHRRSAELVIGWLLASFVPYVLTTELQEFRHYPSQAPLAVLMATALFGANQARKAARPHGPPSSVLLAAVLVAVWLGSETPRSERLAAWRAATAEIEAIHAPVREICAEDPLASIVLVNTEASTEGLLAYYSDRDSREHSWIRFLDTPRALVLPSQVPTGVMVGRRADGSYGRIAPAELLDGKRPLEPVRLYRRFVRAGGFDEAEELLAQPTFDAGDTAVVEGPAELFASFESGGQDPGTVDVVAPLLDFANPEVYLGRYAQMIVRVETSAPAILAVQYSGLYDRALLLARDYALINGVEERRVVQTTCRGRDGELASFPLNGMGMGVIVPAGRHELTLRWEYRRPTDPALIP